MILEDIYYKIFTDYSFIKFTLLIIAINYQFFYFYQFIIKQLQRGMIDLFKDTQMKLGRCNIRWLFMMYNSNFCLFANLNLNNNIILSVVLIYILLYFTY